MTATTAKTRCTATEAMAPCVLEDGHAGAHDWADAAWQRAISPQARLPRLVDAAGEAGFCEAPPA